jgi:hydrogenase maturation protease
LVIGVGNDDRGDDGVGLSVARMLMRRAPAYLRVAQSDGEATALMHQIAAAQHVWVIDAAHSGAPPGTIHRIDCAAGNAIVPRGTVSSHGLGVAESIGLARALGVLPPHCIVYAIEAADFTPGAAPSPAVTRAAHEVADRILAELATLPPP